MTILNNSIQGIKWMKFLMLPPPLTNFEMQKYYQNEPKFNGVHSRNNLPKIKDGAYVINPVGIPELWVLH